MPKTPSPNYNIGTGKKYTVADVLSFLITEMGLPENHPIKEVAGSPGDLFGSVADITRARVISATEPNKSPGDPATSLIGWFSGSPISVIKNDNTSATVYFFPVPIL